MKLGLFDVTVWYDVVLSAKHETPRRYPLGNILFSAILDASLGLISKYHRDWIKAKGFILLIPFQHDCFLIQLSCWCFPVKICKIWSEKDSWQLPFNQSFPFISLTEISSPEKKRFSPQKAVERKRRAALLAPHSPCLFIPRHTGACRTGRCSPASRPALPLPSSVLRTHFLLKLFFLFFFFEKKNRFWSKYCNSVCQPQVTIPYGKASDAVRHWIYTTYPPIHLFFMVCNCRSLSRPCLISTSYFSLVAHFAFKVQVWEMSVSSYSWTSPRLYHQTENCTEHN